MTPEMDLPLDNPNPHVQVYAVLNAAVGEYELVGPGYLSILTDEVEGSTVHYLEVRLIGIRPKTSSQRRSCSLGCDLRTTTKSRRGR